MRGRRMIHRRGTISVSHLTVNGMALSRVTGWLDRKLDIHRCSVIQLLRHRYMAKSETKRKYNNAHLHKYIQGNDVANL